MKLLYFILLISSFLMGWYDNGDITVFVFLFLGGIVVGADKLIDKIREKRKKNSRINSRKGQVLTNADM